MEEPLQLTHLQRLISGTVDSVGQSAYCDGRRLVRADPKSTKPYPDDSELILGRDTPGVQSCIN